MPSAAAASGTAREIGSSVVRVERHRLAPVSGLRAAVGVGLPLTLGVVLGHPVTAVSATVGALSAGFVSLRGAYRTRALAVGATALAMALAAFAGGLAGNYAPAVVLLLACAGFGAGMLSALGPTATIIGLQSVIALLVVSRYPMGLPGAARQAGLVVGGAAVQLLLVTAAWPFRRYPAERATLTAAYRSLADYAAGLSAGSLPDPATVADARRALADPQPFGGSERRTAYDTLLDEAERVRTTLVALASRRDQLAAAGQDAAAAAVTGIATGAAEVLADVAEAVRRADRPAALVTGAALFGDFVDRRAREVAGLDASTAGLARRVAAHLGHVAAALVEHERSPHDEPAADTDDPADPGGARAPVFRLPPAVSPAALVETLRANLTVSSAVWRHAVRLAVTLAAADVVAEWSGLPHGYWVPLTALVVLRADFLGTYSRGVGRVVGTLAGAGLATLLVATLRPGPLALALCVAVLAWCAYALVQVNYVVFGAMVTALVVLLLSFVGLPEVQAVGQRIVDTLVGGALALAAFAAWPTWEAPGARAGLARLLTAQAEYAAAVLRAYGDPAHRDPPALRRRRSAARLARSNAEASVARLRSEPHRRAALDPGAAEELLADVRRFAVSALALEAGLVDARPVDARRAGAVADGVTARLGGLAALLGAAPAAAPAGAGGAPPAGELRAAADAFARAAHDQPAVAAESERLAALAERLESDVRAAAGR